MLQLAHLLNRDNLNDNRYLDGTLPPRRAFAMGVGHGFRSSEWTYSPVQASSTTT